MLSLPASALTVTNSTPIPPTPATIVCPIAPIVNPLTLADQRVGAAGALERDAVRNGAAVERDRHGQVGVHRKRVTAGAGSDDRASIEPSVIGCMPLRVSVSA